MSLKLWLLATFLVAASCFNPDVAPCGEGGLCKEEEPKAQDAAQGLLSMGSFAHRPPESQLAAHGKKLVKPDDTPANPLPHAQKQAAVPASNPLALAQDLKNNKQVQGKGSKTQQQVSTPLSSNPVHQPHHDSADNDHVESEHPDEVFDEDLDTDEGVATDVVQAVEGSSKTKCTPCSYELYTEKGCKGDVAQTITLGCEKEDCKAESQVSDMDGAVASIKAFRKGCAAIMVYDGKRQFARFPRKGEFPKCSDTKETPRKVRVRDMANCPVKRRR